MNIPVKYKLIYSGSESILECQYWYGDSSVIYITNSISSINEEKVTTEIGELGFRGMLSTRDTTMMGIDENGLYWKDIELNLGMYLTGCIGYANVSKEKKDIFDNILNTTRIKFLRNNFFTAHWAFIRTMERCRDF